jgi:hypothetical protein
VHLRRCLKWGVHCRIFFVTDRRNGGRTDLGCPFGCREAQYRKRSGERSRDYYRSPAGKLKKKALNGKRRRPPSVEPGGAERPGEEASRAEASGIELDTHLVGYLSVVVSMIEGQAVILTGPGSPTSAKGSFPSGRPHE